MELLRQRHGIQSLTWLHLGSVDRETKRRVESGEASVRHHRDHLALISVELEGVRRLGDDAAATQ
jgi:hypothetical protein